MAENEDRVCSSCERIEFMIRLAEEKVEQLRRLISDLKTELAENDNP